MNIVIIAALDEELKPLKEFLNLAVATDIAQPFKQFKTNKIFLVKSGIGKTNASLSVAFAHYKLAADLIINVGSAGGICKNLALGDVVLAEAVAFHDFDLSCFGYSIGEVPGSLKEFKTKLDLVCVKSLTTDKSKRHIQLHQGLILSGDRFVSSNKEHEFLTNTFQQPLACEMEAAAIGFAAHHYQIPFIVVRAISDILGNQGHKDFEANLNLAAANASDITLAIVQQLGSNNF